MNTLPRLFFRAWRPAVAVLSLALITYVLYFHNLSHLLPGYSTAELQTYRSASNWHTIVHNPVNAPYKLLVLFGIVLGQHGLLLLRLIAASFGVLAVLLFFIITRAWFSFRIAFLSTTLFATSAGFLHAARFGTPEILQMGILLLIGAVLWYRQSRRTAISGYVMVAALALLCYVPGMIWFELFSLVVLYKGTRRRLAGTAAGHIVAWVILFLGLISPLILAVVHMPQLSLVAADLPANLHALAQTPLNILKAALAISVHSTGKSDLWVGHAPLLDATELILGLLGVYYHLVVQRSGRSVFLIGATLISVVLIGLGGTNVFAGAIPLIYLFIASGLYQLLSLWFSVFPRNPVARSTGLLLVCIMLFFSVLYQARSYFIAWPHSAATRHDFRHTQL